MSAEVTVAVAGLDSQTVMRVIADRGLRLTGATGAVIEGDLHTQEAVIAGQVSGGIYAKDRVELQATAVVSGDILTPRIAIVEGARVTGEVKMDSSEVAGAVADSHRS